MQTRHPSYRTVSYIAALAFLAAILVACQSSGAGFRSEIIPPERRIPLQPTGTHQGEFDTKELVVGYAYQVTEGPQRELHIQGGVRKVRFKSSVVNVYLDLLDSTGLVIQKKVLVATSQTRGSLIKRPRTFDTTLVIPPEAKYMAFRSFTRRAQSNEGK
jgi:hypothetical protein